MLIWGASLAGGIAQSEYAQSLPSFNLQDPFGKRISDDEVSPHGVILVVSAPTARNEDEQRGWGRVLKLSRKDGPKLVFLQDLTAARFEELARTRMKQEYQPGTEPYVLLDEDGRVRQSLGVAEGDTVVLAYDKSRRLVHVEQGSPSQERAVAIWRALGE